VSKGIGANMLKAGSKRRRTTAEIKAEKEAALLKEQEIQAKLAQYDAMKAKAEALEAKIGEHEGAALIVNDLVARGLAVVDNEGRI